MSAMDVNKAVGSVLLVLMAIWVIGIVAEALVKPREQAAASVSVAARHEAAEPKEEKKEKVIPKIGPLLAKASVEHGAKVFRKCRACHNAKKGAGAKVGPNLWNVVNADRARRKDFSYSSAMLDKKGNWTYEALNQFLTKPRDYIPGTKMTFAGLRKPEDRADVIAYLRTLNDSPPPLP